MLDQSPVSFCARAGLALVLLSTMLAVACGRSDSDVKEAIEAQLAKDPVTAPLQLTVDVREGIASLSGLTRSVDEQTRAAEIARGVVGVSAVVNEMELDEDEQLITAVRRALSDDPLLASVPIDVDARDGFVRLMSDATNAEQRERAVAVARAVDGVTDVEDRMK